MIRLHGRILLVFRGGEEGQIGSARARINIFESRDHGRTFTLLSEVNANNLPGGRDIRDPKLVEMGGRLFLYAISRVPGFHYRDLGGQAWTVRAESTDGGRTWTPPVRTYQDVDATGAETFWGFWRYTKRPYTKAGKHRRTLFATGYQDFDTAVGLFASDDGITWEKRSTIIASYNDVPSEAELQFFGKNHDTAVALVRLDNQDILADGQTAICTSHDPFVTWECGRRIEQRLDGPTWVVRRAHGRVRSFVFARKHLPCTFKRTAIYELRGDLTDPGAAIEVCEIQELKSSGDTAYTSLAPLSRNRSLLAWYSSPVDQELPWFQGISSPSDIWLADVDFRRAPAGCVHPPPEHGCEPPPLPADTAAFDVTGAHLLTVAPVIWPAQILSFRADAQVHGTSLDLTLQPLDGVSKAARGRAMDRNRCRDLRRRQVHGRFRHPTRAAGSLPAPQRPVPDRQRIRPQRRDDLERRFLRVRRRLRPGVRDGAVGQNPPRGVDVRRGAHHRRRAAHARDHLPAAMSQRGSRPCARLVRPSGARREARRGTALPYWAGREFSELLPKAATL